MDHVLKCLNVRHKIIKFLDKNKEENLQKLGFSKQFLYLTPKV